MKVSTNWLSDYVDLGGVPVNEITRVLDLVGIEVEGFEEIGGGFDNVVVARVDQVSAHPDADRLSVCTVSDGAESYQVVCGAPNVRAGMVSALAKLGATLPAGNVKKAKIRGVESFGMLVSKRELGLSEDHSGIMDLPADLPLGKDLSEALDLADTVIELSITPNRPDQLSMIGIARELAAAFGKPMKRPDLAFENIGGAIEKEATVEIVDPDLCPRYTGILVKGLKIAPSPNWMAQRLEACGVRSINNIVDITNYVQLECGQPLHGFDFNFLQNHGIIVRRARQDEKMTTLDEQERKLSTNNLVICDATDRPVALAGVMGGLNSLVTDETEDVFIESAYFDPANIRATSKSIGLSSESSYRFERGIDIDGVPWGLHRAARLMAELGNGTVTQGFIDNYPGNKPPKTVRMRPARANWLLGTELSVKEQSALLEAIELPVQEQGEELVVTVPNFRVDLEREVDIIEEISRLYGLEKIADEMPPAQKVTPRLSDERTVEIATRESLVALGMFETINFAFTRKERLDRFRETPGDQIHVLNPFSEDFAYMRDTLLPGLCGAAAYNLKRQAKRVQLFEVRRVYLPCAEAENQHIEPLHTAGIIAGRAEPEGWSQQKRDVDFFDLKGILEELFMALRIDDRITYAQGNAYHLDTNINAEVRFDGKPMGTAGLLKKSVRESFDIDVPAFCFELDLSAVQGEVMKYGKFTALSKFPVTTRDLAVVVDAAVDADAMIRVLSALDATLVREVICFDIYVGDKIGIGKKSLAFSMRLQKDNAEVTEGEADKLVTAALALLTEKFGAKLRE